VRAESEGRETPNALPGPRRHEWTIVAGLALLALILGYLGLRDVYEDEQYSRTQILYRSLQLFVLESGAVETDSVPLTLEIARILAPAVAAYAAVRAVIALFREQLQLLGHRFRLRGHVIVVGLGTKGARLARAFHDEGRRVVAIEENRQAANIVAVRRHGVHVLIGDARDPAVLAEARLSRARYLVVTAGDDRRNLDILFMAAATVTPRARGAVTAFVHLNDLTLWRRLQARLLATPERPALRPEFFNVTEAAARTLVDRHPPFDAGRQSKGGVLVVGTGALAQSVVVAAARAWRLGGDPSERLHITIAGSDAPASRAALGAAQPGLASLVALETWPLQVGRLDAEAIAGRGQPEGFETAYICEDDEAAGLAAALALSERSEAAERIVLAVEDEAAGVGRALGPYLVSGQLELFGVLSSALTPTLLIRGANEILARVKHAHYIECERERGAVDGNASCVPWDRLDESLKESNRLFADSIGRKLAAAGCVLVPAPLDGPKPIFAFSADEVEELARAEHERWCDDLVGEGWRWGRAKDPERRLHPSLVPWSELTEEERDKDREPVRELPRMLALVGFEIQRKPPLPPEEHSAGADETVLTSERARPGA
jgi:hypothetical protein